MVPIYIPSRRRAHQLKSEFCPIHQMDDVMRSRVTYVVPDGDEDEYVFDLPPSIKVVGFRGHGIAEKRKFIGELAAKAGHEKFMMVDDDIKWFTREHFFQTNLVPAGSYDLNLMMRIVNSFLEHGYAHVGISAREGNNRQGTGGPNDLFEQNTRILRVHAFWTEIYNSVEHCRVDFMEDFDVSLQILEKGYKNANLYFWCQDQRQTQAPGGCDYRTHASHERAATRLAELHPQVVTLRDKENKTGGAFGKRKEVTVQWKKAYELAGTESHAAPGGSGPVEPPREPDERGDAAAAGGAGESDEPAQTGGV